MLGVGSFMVEIRTKFKFVAIIICLFQSVTQCNKIVSEYDRLDGVRQAARRVNGRESESFCQKQRLQKQMLRERSALALDVRVLQCFSGADVEAQIYHLCKNANEVINLITLYRASKSFIRHFWFVLFYLRFLLRMLLLLQRRRLLISFFTAAVENVLTDHVGISE